MSVCAGVVELVDTLDSGSSVRKDMGVRVSPSAPFSYPTKSRKAPKALRDLCFSGMARLMMCRKNQGHRT